MPARLADSARDARTGCRNGLMRQCGCPRDQQSRAHPDRLVRPGPRHQRGQRDFRSPVTDDDRREVPRFLQSGARDTEPRKFWKQGIRRRAARTRFARVGGSPGGGISAAMHGPSAGARLPRIPARAALTPRNRAKEGTQSGNLRLTPSCSSPKPGLAMRLVESQIA
jgi:hypothetical protein